MRQPSALEDNRGPTASVIVAGTWKAVVPGKV